MNSKISNIFRRIIYLPWTVRFNLHYLPFRQAIRLPFVFYVRPIFIKLRGKVILDTPEIHTGMIKLGICSAPISSYDTFRWENMGTIVYKGKGAICEHAFVSCGKEGHLEIGNDFLFNEGCRIICHHKITFEDKFRSSWDCTFIDTNFHTIIDIVQNTPIKMKAPIHLGYGAWVGHNSIICKGVKLPAYTIVSSGSVVKTSFKKEKIIIGGNPAQFIDEGYQRKEY